MGLSRLIRQGLGFGVRADYLKCKFNYAEPYLATGGSVLGGSCKSFGRGRRMTG